MANDLTVVEGADQVASLFVPISKKQILLPNVTVAELIGYVTPKTREYCPEWLIGDMEWRNTIIPIVSLEAYGGEEAPNTRIGARIAVLNGVSNQRALPFWGIVTQGIPRLVKVEEESIIQKVDQPLAASEAMLVEINGDQAYIPDLDKIEKSLVELMQS